MNLIEKSMVPLIYQYDYEIWVPLNIYPIIENTYEISNFGNIRRIKDSYILKQQIINSGYYTISLLSYDEFMNRIQKRYLVHRLVGMIFNINYNCYNLTINHLNCNKLYNHADNLQWVTQKENNDYKYTYGNGLQGEDIYNAKFTNEQVHIICQGLELGLSYKQIISNLGINPPKDLNDNIYDRITNIKRGLCWTQISSQYNINRFQYNGSKNFNNEQVHLICKCLEDGKSYGEIYEILYNKKYKGSKQNKSFYEFIRKLKNKQTFLNISSQYNI